MKTLNRLINKIATDFQSETLALAFASHDLGNTEAAERSVIKVKHPDERTGIGGGPR
jgi:hypothetical protein